MSNFFLSNSTASFTVNIFSASSSDISQPERKIHTVSYLVWINKHLKNWSHQVGDRKYLDTFERLVHCSICITEQTLNDNKDASFYLNILPCHSRSELLAYLATNANGKKKGKFCLASFKAIHSSETVLSKDCIVGDWLLTKKITIASMQQN